MSVGATAGPLDDFDMPVTFRTDPAIVDNGRSVRELTRWRSVGDHLHTVGLYRQKTRSKVRLEGELLLFGAGALFRATRAELDISTDHAIYVGAEFPPGSCQYEQALEHERMHEQIHVQAIERLLPEIEREVRAQLRAAPMEAGVDLQGQLEAAASAAGNVASQMILEHTSELHSAFDSPQEYERIQAACSGAMGRTVRSARSR